MTVLLSWCFSAWSSQLSPELLCPGAAAPATTNSQFPPGFSPGNPLHLSALVSPALYCPVIKQDSPVKSFHSSLQPVPILSAINNCAPSAHSPDEVLSLFSRSFITMLSCTSTSTDARTPPVTSRLLWDPARTSTLRPLSLNSLLSLIYPTTNGFRKCLNSIRFPSFFAWAAFQPYSWSFNIILGYIIEFNHS